MLIKLPTILSAALQENKYIELLVILDGRIEFSCGRTKLGKSSIDYEIVLQYRVHRILQNRNGQNRTEQ